MNKSDITSKTMSFFMDRKVNVVLLRGEFARDSSDIKTSHSDFDSLLHWLSFCNIKPVIFHNISELSAEDLDVTLSHSQNIRITLSSYSAEYGEYVGQVSSAEFHVVLEDGRKVYAEYQPLWKKELDEQKRLTIH